MTTNPESLICSECGGKGFHQGTCSRRFVPPIPEPPLADPMFQARVDGTIEPLPNPHADREAEYRRIWLERAGSIFDKESGFASDGRCDAALAFKAADMFLAELRRRDGEGL